GSIASTFLNDSAASAKLPALNWLTPIDIRSPADGSPLACAAASACFSTSSAASVWPLARSEVASARPASLSPGTHSRYLRSSVTASLWRSARWYIAARLKVEEFRSFRYEVGFISAARCAEVKYLIAESGWSALAYSTPML